MNKKKKKRRMNKEEIGERGQINDWNIYCQINWKYQGKENGTGYSFIFLLSFRLCFRAAALISFRPNRSELTFNFE